MKKVRTRFAPSPTGSMHVGNARTAIFNWLYAKRHQGEFILRIEDTDLERSTRENEEKLIEDLKWLGITWDEGPYRQSERTAIYLEHAHQLIKEGKAFYCFCTDAELEAKKQKALEEKRSPLYDGTCARLTKEEIQKKLDQKIPYSIRFKVKQRDVIFHDMIKGEINIKQGMFGDFVIIRSNGMPVYNFSVVVDDALMKITHVIRAEEHLSNTARQILLYEAFGWDIPLFGHTALILAPDGSKLSKRHGATSIEEYRKKGYLPDGLFNYLAILGWTPPEEGKEKLSRQELITLFDTDRIAKNSAKFDWQKLNWLNGEYIKELPWEVLREKLVASLSQKYDLSIYPPEKLEKILKLASRGITYIEEIQQEASLFFEPKKPHIPKEWHTETYLQLLRRLKEEIIALPELEENALVEILKKLGKELNIKGKNLFMPVRLYTTGLEHGPDLYAVLTLLGKERVLQALSQWI